VSLVRRVLNLVTNAIATDITRRLSDVLAGTELEIVHDEGSLFRVVLAARSAG
jgi:hypothetical protein